MIQEVLTLYSDCSDEIKKLLIDALLYLENVDRIECLKYCNSLCELKRIYPKFTIKVTNDKRSRFIFYNDTVLISEDDLTNVSTLFHELTHAFHYYKNNFLIPDVFERIMFELRNNKINKKNFVTILKYIKDKYEINKDEYIDNDKIDGSESDEMVSYIQVLQYLEDMIDAVYFGRLHDEGLFYEKDRNSYCVNISKTSGHGENYFAIENTAYLEMIADYAAIRNSTFNKDLLEIMRLLFGEELMLLLEKEYLEIMNLNSYNKDMNNSNNIRK